MDLSELRLMNAAGRCKDLVVVEKLARTQISEITVGSITREQRAGNDGSVFWNPDDEAYALNSLGLPNPGIEAFAPMLPYMRNIADAKGKKLRVSIAGFNQREYGFIAHRVARFAHVIEINLGCPNVWGSEGQKPIAAFDINLTENILDIVEDAVDEAEASPRIAVKLSPYSNPLFLAEMAMLLNINSDFVNEVVLSNTFPNCFAWDDGKPAITVGSGLAGMSGAAMKAIALGQAVQFREKLAESISITGVGGITCGEDILDFALAGITSVQVGTHYFLHGEKVFGELLAQCVELVE